MVNAGDLTIKSGSPNCAANIQPSSAGQLIEAGISFSSPFGAFESTHWMMISICSSFNDRSFLKSCIPTVLSICQGGISRLRITFLMDLAQGLTSSNPTRDIGAIELFRWHDSHLFWKIGATSFVKVMGCLSSCAEANRGGRMLSKRHSPSLPDHFKYCG
jgi:hypothetical protein